MLDTSTSNRRCDRHVAKSKRDIDPTIIDTDYYEAQVICRNCGKDMMCYFEKGLSIYKHRCPNCECMYLAKH